MSARLTPHNTHLSVQCSSAKELLLHTDESTTYKLLIEATRLWDESERQSRGLVPDPRTGEQRYLTLTLQKKVQDKSVYRYTREIRKGLFKTSKRNIYSEGLRALILHFSWSMRASLATYSSTCKVSLIRRRSRAALRSGGTRASERSARSWLRRFGTGMMSIMAYLRRRMSLPGMMELD
jgi:hypothetical protein